MADIIHITEATLTGPWLISREQLLALDKLVQAEWDKLCELREELLQKEVTASLKRQASNEAGATKIDSKVIRKEAYDRIATRYEFRKSRKLSIQLNGGRRVVVSNFEDAFAEPALLNEAPTGFVLNLECCDVTCSLQVPWYGRELKLRVGPHDASEAKGLFSNLYGWIQNSRPPFWQRWWNSITHAGLHWGLWLISLAAVLAAVWLFAPDSAASARAIRHKEATEVLAAGVSTTNYLKALELILSYETGAIAREHSVKVPNWFSWQFIGGLLFCLALSFFPKVVIGVGRGEESLKYWNQWMRLVGVTFPLWLLSTVFWPKISSLF